MDYVVFDLEWNQASVKEKEVKGMMFEILEIGAVRLDDSFGVVDTFSSYIRPQVYKTLHSMTRRILHLDFKALYKERPFVQVMEDFLAWCGSDFIFCTWGPSDLTELRRNMKYYGMPPLCEGPMKYLDVQKLFSLKRGDGRDRISLENAASILAINESEDFHTALGDARYTADILAGIADRELLKFHSFDNFSLPASRGREIHEYFPTYYKYISRSFRDRNRLLADMEAVTMRCSICKKRSRRVVKWFSPNGGRYFLAVGNCREHGFMKCKLRVKKAENGRVYAVKTIKPADEETALSIRDRYRECVEKRKSSSPGRR